MAKQRAKQSRVSRKISHLVHEGVPRRTAVAEALNMERKGRLTPSGGYKRVKRKKRAKR